MRPADNWVPVIPENRPTECGLCIEACGSLNVRRSQTALLLTRPDAVWNGIPSRADLTPSATTLASTTCLRMNLEP